MKRLLLFTGVALALCLVAAVAWPQAAAADNGLIRTTFPSAEDPGLPFYARFEPNAPHVPTDGVWAAIVFIRDPACAEQEGVNLLAIDFGATCMLTIHGANYWEGEPHTLPPKISTHQGNGHVPIWFVPASAIASLVADGIVTVAELSDVSGLLVGHAEQYSQVLHPPSIPALGGGGHPHPKLIVTAHGQLEDGRAFSLQNVVVNREDVVVNIEFR